MRIHHTASKEEGLEEKTVSNNYGGMSKELYTGYSSNLCVQIVCDLMITSCVLILINITRRRFHSGSTTGFFNLFMGIVIARRVHPTI